MPEQKIVDDFHKLYYASRVWEKTFWLGVPVLKCPLDMWVYQEIILETKPDVIIECGTHKGGSALFMASMCDLAGTGKIITIDIRQNPERPVHPRIKYILGSSIDPKTVDAVRALLKPGARVMAVLDSDHRKQHVLDEMRIYGQLVTDGQYLIVEDTNHGHPVPVPNPAEGPIHAVREFLAENRGFTVDRSKEKYHLTFNSSGFLKKRSA